MAMSYYKTFTVPFWVILGETKNNKTIIKWFKEAAAREQAWPANTFKDTVEGFKKKGWMHVWKEPVLTIPPQLFAMAMDVHVNSNLSQFSALEYKAIHRINRTIKSDADYVKMFNDVINQQKPEVLSQAFQVAEICHDENKANRPQVWVTEEPCERLVISKIADQVITVGEGSGYDIDVSDKSAKKIPALLSEKMVELYSNKR